MSETTTTKPTKIEFIQYHKPALIDGDYEINVQHDITEVTGEKITSNNSFTVTRTFSVAGERFDLKPADIHAVFPPAGSLGEHSNVLPHIILNRSTLPWERQADGNNKNLPWLALLLFEEGEKLGGTIEKDEFIKQYTKETPSGDRVWEHLLEIGWLKSIDSTKAHLTITASNSKLEGDFDSLESQVNSILDQSRTPKVITVTELQNSEKDGVKFPQLALESGQHKEDKLTVIDVEKQLLDKILPTKEDLEYLAHVRQGTDDQGTLVGDELAVIIGNRLPKKGRISTVHLVSIEGLYDDKRFNFQKAENNDYIRLVSLKSWRFACVDEKQSFKGLLTHINREPSTLRLPKVDNAEAEGYLSMGFVPLPHFLRKGGKTFSWYHSPLITGNNPTDNITLPIRAADEIVRYNPSNGMFDISYASAWELGRLLALQSKNFSISLYHWKRSHKQALKSVEAAIDSHLPFHDLPNVELPSEIKSWFSNLSLLKGIPFNYLVPDEKMLPLESIRFFWVDPLWLECLLDGAFSIGRVTTSDHADDSSHKENNNNPATNPHEEITGFLLRSDVVAGWPGLLVDGYGQSVDNDNPIPENDKLPLLRMDRLSANVLICLFKGEVKTVDIHQKPETIHFGLDSDDGELFYKELKNQDGSDIEVKLETIPWKNKDSKTLNISQLKSTIESKLRENNITFSSFTSAQFALEMIEGVEKVRFSIER
ncbi:MAG: hypothetical protein AB4060_09515 [Crocosphaera sp.]